ncbi:Hypothetical protein FNO222_1838 [Francisella orientalis]|uniref:Uncharacterized protein n=1 Tax=Francisella orientalis TaxID=299583 RepID=A0ABM5U831_9GAMM|nr:hypothetical protein FNO12_1824 [Francisella orientalis FNO12]AKN87850.1 Hypothetical protein FNO24_1826 [Francisella orientalis FNO24]AKN89389.1 Hypothetical protein FNO190_1824 [Francisella orientalis]AKU06148.1 Hypothetical protein FNO01_1824 [Francisella orientalis]QEN21064.1 Hypothetical protein FNO39_1838 [Francisella orientalis]
MVTYLFLFAALVFSLKKRLISSIIIILYDIYK